MSWIFHVPLQETTPVAERRQRLRRGALELRLDLVQGSRDAHALAAAHQGLDHDGEAELLRERALLRRVEALSVPGTTGTFAAMAIFRAETLSEKESKFSTVGPTNVMPRSPHNRASSGDSDKKP